MAVGFHIPARNQAVWSWYLKGEDYFHDDREPFFIVGANRETGTLKIQSARLSDHHVVVLLAAIAVAQEWLLTAPVDGDVGYLLSELKR